MFSCEKFYFKSVCGNVTQVDAEVLREHMHVCFHHVFLQFDTGETMIPHC